MLVSAAPSVHAAENIDVKIIDRQNHESLYTYTVPGSSVSNSNTEVSCSGNVSNVNCTGNTQTTATSRPGFSGSYQVSGATFSLQLPDGRVAVVNCDSKLPPVALSVAVALASGGGGSAKHRRSCRMPLVNDIQAEFSGDNAKLKWSVSIDGKKLDSETYKILAVLDKP